MTTSNKPVVVVPAVEAVTVTTFTNNVALGYKVLRDNTWMHHKFVMHDNTTGTNNTAIGYAALKNNNTGFNNTATGNAALRCNAAGNYKVS